MYSSLYPQVSGLDMHQSYANSDTTLVNSSGMGDHTDGPPTEDPSGYHFTAQDCDDSVFQISPPHAPHDYGFYNSHLSLPPQPQPIRHRSQEMGLGLDTSVAMYSPMNSSLSIPSAHEGMMYHSTSPNNFHRNSTPMFSTSLPSLNNSPYSASTSYSPHGHPRSPLTPHDQTSSATMDPVIHSPHEVDGNGPSLLFSSNVAEVTHHTLSNFLRSG
jgi:hypothetical protein